MRGEWARWEKRMAERLEYIEDTALSAQNSIYKRMPGIGLDAAQDARGEDVSELQKTIEALTRRVVALERSADSEGCDSLRQMVVSILDDELVVRQDEIKREATQAARKASSHEVRCKLEALENDIQSRTEEGWEKVKSSMARTLSDFKASVEREVDTNVSQAMQTAANVKQSITNVLMWKDMIDSRFDDTDRDWNAHMFRLKTSTDDKLHELRSALEKLITDMDDKSRRRVEQITLVFATEERLMGTTDQMKTEMHSLASRMDGLHEQQLTLRTVVDERANGTASELRASFDTVHGQLNKGVAESRDELHQLSAEMMNSRQALAAKTRDMESSLSKVRNETARHVDTLNESLRNELKQLQQTMREDCETLLSDALDNKKDMSPRFKEQRTYTDNLRRDLERLREDVSTLKTWAEREMASSPTRSRTRPPLPQSAAPPPAPVIPVEDGGGWSSGYETGATSSVIPSSPDMPSLHVKHLTHLASIAQAVRSLQTEVVASVHGPLQVEGGPGAGISPAVQHQGNPSEPGEEGAVSPSSPNSSAWERAKELEGPTGFVPDATATLNLIEKFKTTARECTLDSQLEGMSLHMSEASERDTANLDSCATSDISMLPSPTGRKGKVPHTLPTPDDATDIDESSTPETTAKGSAPERLPSPAVARRLPTFDDTATTPSSVTSDDIFPFRKSEVFEEASTNT
eukprot:TRINITY_DN50391_c0_g1_i1.p1 TRINITY_DN50391_c0_g1~~TRINITY_DN50391_c0_g1_i1.p1  ORF type:complete len:795 (+),score=235.36 TRINITY_DN50391_c0_g1_i1:304-2385(+)